MEWELLYMTNKIYLLLCPAKGSPIIPYIVVLVKGSHQDFIVPLS